MNRYDEVSDAWLDGYLSSNASVAPPDIEPIPGTLSHAMAKEIRRARDRVSTDRETFARLQDEVDVVKVNQAALHRRLDTVPREHPRWPDGTPMLVGHAVWVLAWDPSVGTAPTYPWPSRITMIEAVDVDDCLTVICADGEEFDVGIWDVSQRVDATPPAAPIRIIVSEPAPMGTSIFGPPPPVIGPPFRSGGVISGLTVRISDDEVRRSLTARLYDEASPATKERNR